MQEEQLMGKAIDCAEALILERELTSLTAKMAFLESDIPRLEEERTRLDRLVSKAERDIDWMRSRIESLEMENARLKDSLKVGKR